MRIVCFSTNQKWIIEVAAPGVIFWSGSGFFFWRAGSGVRYGSGHSHPGSATLKKKYCLHDIIVRQSFQSWTTNRNKKSTRIFTKYFEAVHVWYFGWKKVWIVYSFVFVPKTRIRKGSRKESFIYCPATKALPPPLLSSSLVTTFFLDFFYQS